MVLSQASLHKNLQRMLTYILKQSFRTVSPTVRKQTCANLSFSIRQASTYPIDDIIFGLTPDEIQVV